MPINSIFLPGDGLQGEDIPSHMTWKDLRYSYIKINLPPFLKLKEIYNVNENQWKINQNTLIVKGVEVDGYLGLLFESIRSGEEKEKHGEVSYFFLNTEDEIIFQTKKSLSLFRPFISIETVPKHIKISFPKKEIDNKIKLTNSGRGTAIIGIETTEKSEVRKKSSKIEEEFVEEFIKDMEKEIARLKKKFPEYSQFLDMYYQYRKEPEWEKEEFLEEFNRIVEKDVEFLYDLGNSVAWAIMNNVHFETIIESFFSYWESLATNKILIYNPLDVIKVSKKTKKIDLRVLQQDLLMRDYDPIEISSIEISTNKAGTIEVHRLFEWGNDGN